MPKSSSIAAAIANSMCLLLAPAAGFADSPAPPAPPGPLAPQEAGVWQKHEYSFAFMGFTSTYSCDGLADKLKLLLIASGARADAKARAGACASGFGRPDKFARADLTFYALAPAAGDKPADATTTDGSWRGVILASRRPRELGAGDCELVEQFKSNVLPMFATRNIDSHTTCIPHQLSGSTIDLRFDVFAAPQRKNSRTSAAGVQSPTGF